MSGIVGGAGIKSGVIGFQGIENPFAFYSGVFTGDGSSPETSGYTYTCPLNTENDPSNLATLSSNRVTLSKRGRYYIEGLAGVFGFYSETGSSSWGKLELCNQGGSVIVTGHDFAGKDYLDFSSQWYESRATVKHLGVFDAGDGFELRIVMSGDGWMPRWWQGTSGSSQMPSLNIHYLGVN
jgi:hypothetical protein